MPTIPALGRQRWKEHIKFRVSMTQRERGGQGRRRKEEDRQVERREAERQTDRQTRDRYRL